MSDPVTNVEIEDVLSSIRRLVSEDTRALPPVSQPSPAEPAGAAKLVLTPAHRVVETNGEEAEAAPFTHVEEHEAALPTTEPEPARAELERQAPLEDISGEEAFETLSDDPFHDEEGHEEESAADSDGAAEDGADGEAEPTAPEPQSQEDRAQHDDSAEDPHSVASLEAKIAQLEAAISAQDDEWEPDGSEVTHDDSVAHDILSLRISEETEDEQSYSGPGWDEPDASDEHGQDEGHDQEGDDQGHADEPQQADQHDQDAAEERHEDDAADDHPGDGDHAEAVGEDRLDEGDQSLDDDEGATDDAPPMFQHSEPAESPVEDHGPEDNSGDQHDAEDAETPKDAGIEWADAEAAVEEAVAAVAAAEVMEQTAEPEPAHDAGPVEDFLREDETVLDEDVLRDMVADIVRRELQGELGERITRNVRRLVRREIHRALASQDFE